MILHHGPNVGTHFLPEKVSLGGDSTQRQAKIFLRLFGLPAVTLTAKSWNNSFYLFYLFEKL
jgi:hypothetical protein